MGTTGLPVVEHSGCGRTIDPEVALGCAAVFSVKVIDGCFIYIEVVAFSHVPSDDVVEWLEGVGSEFRPVAEGGTGDVDTRAALKDLFLPVIWKVVVVFGC